jgi:soluble lytic murein transglycosylase
MAYYRANRNPQSAGDFAAALAARDLTPATRCVATFHLADSWFKERRRDRAAPLYDEAIAACKAAGNSDLAVRAAYQAGRAYCLLDQHEVALGRFEQAEAQRDHSYADDARKRRAEEYAELGQDAQVVDMLARLPELYPEGDMRAEAMWRLAFRAWRAGNDTAAAGWLHKQIAAAPVETRWYAEGQPQYWLGRIAARRGDRAQALHWYRECVRLYPLSYYSLLALNRLREQFPGEFEELSASLRRAGDEATPPVTVPAALVDSPGFQRAVEFTRLGLNRQAGLELVHLGLRTPPGKAQVADPQQVTRLWLLAFFYDALGRHDRAHWLARWHVLDYRRHWPQGAWRHKWRVAYPLAYHQLVAEAAAEHGYPAALQMAIMREESGFDPNLESYAGAVGLTQMIVPTAREYARGTGLRINRYTLRDPRLNVRIGSRFLASLWQRFGGHPGLVIPSYNPGAGATRRWLAARPDWQWDEWEEAILDDQARNYTKRVLASYLTYSFLHDGTIPVLPQTLPGPPRVAVSPTAPSR